MTVDGSVDPRFEAVRDAFERNFVERDEIGASVCVTLDGETVVDLWGGVADPDTNTAWERDTSPDSHRGVGAELMSELRFGYLFVLQARAGIAKGLDAPGRTTGYLRVGRSF